MNRGRRYEEPQLNKKKVFAVIMALVVIIMCIITINTLLEEGENDESSVGKTYFAAFDNDKWGVIDETGQYVIVPAYSELIIIPDNTKDVFICTYDVNYETGEYKTKVLNSKNQEIFTQYEDVQALVSIYSNNQISYEKDILKVEKEEKIGIVNVSGKEILEPIYNSITTFNGITGVVKVEKDGLYGVYTSEGKEIIPVQYADIEILGDSSESGYIIKGTDGKYGTIAASGEARLPVNYEKIEKVEGNNLFVISENGVQKLIAPDGIVVLESGFEEIKYILEKEQGIIYVQDGKYGVMDISGQVIIQAEYEELLEAKDGVFIAKKEGKYGIIDNTNNTKVDFNYYGITYMNKADLYIAESDSYINDIIDNEFTVRQTGYLIKIDEEKGYFELNQNSEFNYYDFNYQEKKLSDIYPQTTLFVSKKDDKYGFVDEDGNVVVDYIYDSVTEQNEYGFAGIKKDGKWGSVDKTGAVVQEPKYSLEEYLIIDFIGIWHYGQDLNMNYYNKL